MEKKKKERKETNPSLNLPFSTVENTRDTRYQEYSSSFSLREVEGRNVKAVFTLSFVEEFPELSTCHGNQVEAGSIPDCPSFN